MPVYEYMKLKLRKCGLFFSRVTCHTINIIRRVREGEKERETERPAERGGNIQATRSTSQAFFLRRQAAFSLAGLC